MTIQKLVIALALSIPIVSSAVTVQFQVLGVLQNDGIEDRVLASRCNKTNGDRCVGTKILTKQFFTTRPTHQLQQGERFKIKDPYILRTSYDPIEGAVSAVVSKKFLTETPMPPDVHPRPMR